MSKFRKPLASIIRLGIALLAAVFAASSSWAQVIDPSLWGTNGGVSAVARIGSTLYIGGAFTAIGPCTGGGVPVDRASAVPRVVYPHVAGRVSAVVSDGAGGWFVGGHFDAVEGQPRAHLVHVLADGTLSPWAPGIVGEERLVEEPWLTIRPPGVSALLLRGNTLYVGGRFASVNGIARRNLAALDATTGVLLAWNPDADDEVRCLALRGNTLYVGGEFHRVGGLDRHHIAALDAQDGRPTSWNPDAEERVRSLAIDGRTIYAAGDFQAIGGQPRNCLAALDAGTGAATAWNPGLTPLRRGVWLYDGVWPFVSAVAVRKQTVYASGYFDGARGQARRYFCAFDTRTGDMTPFAPQADAWAFAIVPAGNLLYVGGDWYNMGGAAIPHVAALDATTGRATPWNPRANGLVEALGIDPTTAYIGGSFTSLHDWQLSEGFAALDLQKGGLAERQPHIDAHAVERLAAMGDTLYMSGRFTSAGGQPRVGLAAFDTRTGSLTSWDPGALGIGGAIAMIHDRLVYVVGRSTRPLGLAKLDPITAQPTAFDARLDDGVVDLAEANGVVYMTGDFIHVGGVFRPFVAAVDAQTGALLPWNPMANPADLVMSGIEHVAAGGNAVYLGGYFYGTDWFPRQGLAAVDGTTGALLPWSPGPPWDAGWRTSIRVNKLVARGDEVWVGGSFGHLGGRTLTNLAVVDAKSGLPLPVDLRVNGAVNEIVLYGDTVYVGGQFGVVAAMPHSGLFAFVMPPHIDHHAMTAMSVSSTVPMALSLGPCRPNPLNSTGFIGFTLPRGGPVTLSIYDLQGRRVATLLNGEPRAPGFHEARLTTARWRPGVYFCRIEAAGDVATRKFIVEN
ncbi:MAG: T9SS type A sorting domain-containing protein [Candidatus Binatia bacterium]